MPENPFPLCLYETTRSRITLQSVGQLRNENLRAWFSMIHREVRGLDKGDGSERRRLRRDG